MAFRPVAKLDEIPEGRGLCVMLDGREIGLYRVDGAYYAMDNNCPHAGSSLCEGPLVDSLITCPAHGWEFDVKTGRAPGEVDEQPLERFSVLVDGDTLSIDLDAPLG